MGGADGVAVLDSAAVVRFTPARGGRLQRIATGITTHPLVAAVFALGIVLRVVLVPITHGQDFVVWDKASLAMLNGINFYSHHPDYPGGPYAYFPTFLLLELPARWLSLHAGLPFTVLGKVVIVGADIAVAALLAKVIRRRGGGEAAVALGAGLFLLNPLVLYNGAFYGRFDSVCLAVLVAALYLDRSPTLRRGRSMVLYALAVSIKTFPVLLLPRLLRGAGPARTWVVASLAAVLLVVSLPFVADNPMAMVRDIVFWDAVKTPAGLSWQRALLSIMSPADARIFSFLMLAILAAAVIRLARIDDVDRYCLVVMLGFLLCSKVVLEQYLLWPMPWLILRIVTDRSRSAALVLGVLITFGMLVNPYIHPFGEQSPVIGILLAAVLLTYAASLISRGDLTLPRPARLLRWNRS